MEWIIRGLPSEEYCQHSTGITQENHENPLSPNTVFIQMEQKIITNKTYALN